MPTSMITTPPSEPLSFGDMWRARAAGRELPTLPGHPILGNWRAFRRDRLALFSRVGALGPLARFHIGPLPVHVITDAALAQQVLVDRADDFVKMRSLSLFARPIFGSGLLTSEGMEHRRARKLLAPAFGGRRIAGYADVMLSECARAVASWRDGQRIDAAEAMMEMTLAVAGRALFDADMRGDARVVSEALNDAMQSVVASQSTLWQLPYGWPLPRHNRMRRAAAQLNEVVYRVIAERRAQGGDRGDVLSTLVAARDDDGSSMSDRQIRDEVMTLLLAGHETTGDLLSWTVYALARHPEVRARVEAEVDAVLDGRAPTLDDLPRLPYAAMVLDEVLRLWPPVYSLGRQAVREVDIGGVRLRRGAGVVVNVWGLHRRAELFPEPEKFQPERMTFEAKKARSRGAYLPFGVGQRACIGNHFALMEAQIALATIVSAVRLELDEPGPVTPEPLVTLRPLGGLPVRVHARRPGARSRAGVAEVG